MEQQKSYSQDKITCSYFWKRYKEENPSTTLNYDKFRNVVEGFFSKIMIKILQGYVFRMGARLGEIRIVKKKRGTKKDENGRPIPRIHMGLTNIKKLKSTEEQINNKEHLVYRTNLFFHAFQWENNFIDSLTNLVISGRTTYYKFKPSRKNNRMITSFYPEDSIC